MLEAIVAVYSDWGIGCQGTQPVVLKADRAHFRELTKDCAVIVGRKTMEDFPGGKPLKGRRNIVVTRSLSDIPGAELAHSTQEALTLAEGSERCLVIGGDSIYKQFLPYIGLVHVTKIALAPRSDSFFADLDADSHWQCIRQEPWLDEDGLGYCFCTYERVSPQE